MYRQKGFTLIELIVVIVILGLLAATALPRFINVTADARLASVNGVAGGLRSAAALARAQFMVTGSSAATSVSMDGIVVLVNASGYPTSAAGGIETALPSPQGWTITHGATTTYRPNPPNSATCQADYNPSTGIVTVTATTTNCG